jgi:hypothetical protein
MMNVDTIGWYFCLVRQHGSVTATCAKISLTCYGNLFYLFWQAVCSLTVHSNSYGPHNPSFILPAVSSLTGFKFQTTGLFAITCLCVPLDSITLSHIGLGVCAPLFCCFDAQCFAY